MLCVGTITDKPIDTRRQVFLMKKHIDYFLFLQKDKFLIFNTKRDYSNSEQRKPSCKPEGIQNTTTLKQGERILLKGYKKHKTYGAQEYAS